MTFEHLSTIFIGEAAKAVAALQQIVVEENLDSRPDGAPSSLARDLADAAHLVQNVVMESLALELLELVALGKIYEARTCIQELSNALDSGAEFATSSFQRALKWSAGRKGSRQRMRPRPLQALAR